ncbi:DNA-directed RNA polymerase I subunit RPA34.5-domain-containing protein [Bisporella sp. PMI_857]|nr:DNA-directed RNA polymerase I subunit RPA34.5-domain-containing protein [Bisporella sp. PMI_857]
MPSLKAFAKDAKRKVESVEPQKKKTVRNGVVLSNLSTEKITSSDSEEEEESEEDSSSDEGPAPKKVIVNTPKINDSSSDDEAPPPKPKAAVSKTNGKVIADSSDSSSSSDSESSSDERGVGESDEESTSESSEEDSSGSEAPVVKAKEPASLSRPAKQKSSEFKTVAFSDLEPFIPPSGFRLQSIKEVTQASELFSKSNLKGKQIWHITAPASVSMESIKAMSWPDIVQQNAVISHKGNKYGFVQVSNHSTASTKIMVPNSSSDGYHATSKPISTTLHLQQIVDLPVDTTDQSSSARATIPAKKPVRQQPKGLKMRFRPLGFGEGDMGKIGSSSSSSDSESGSDEDMLDRVVKFKKPPFISLDLATKSSKAKGSDTDSSSSTSDSGSDSGSDSDVEMPDVSAPGAKQSTAAKSTTILPPKNGGIKRKHTDDIEDSEKTKGKGRSSTAKASGFN